MILEELIEELRLVADEYGDDIDVVVLPATEGELEITDIQFVENEHTDRPEVRLSCQ